MGCIPICGGLYSIQKIIKIVNFFLLHLKLIGFFQPCRTLVDPKFIVGQSRFSVVSMLKFVTAITIRSPWILYILDKNRHKARFLNSA